MKEEILTCGKRVVYAPNPFGSNQTAIISVIVGPNEEIEWAWGTGIDGKPYVAGYTINIDLK